MTLEFASQTLYAGATWSWTEEIDDYPASEGWTLTILLKHKTDTAIILTATASDDDYEFDIDTTVTEQFTKRTYTYQGIITNTGEVNIIDEGEIEIFPKLDITSDIRTDNEIILDAIVAALKSRATKEQQSISIAGRQIQYLSLQELTDAKKYYESLVAKEKRVASGKTGTPRVLEEY